MPEQTVIFTVTVSDPALLPEGDLSGLLDALEDFQPVLVEWAGIMRDWQRTNYASEGSSFGAAWATDSPKTILSKLRRGFGSRTLIETGAMQAGAGQASEVSGNAITTGWDLSATPYVPYQQAQVGNKPARIVAALVGGEVQEMLDALQTYLDAAAGGAATGLTITTEMI